MIHPDVLAEWVNDIHLIVDYEPEATVWDLFKFEYMKLHGDLPPNVEIDYPNEYTLRQLTRNGWSPLDIAVKLEQPRWLVIEALDFFEIPYCVETIDASGIVKEFRSGILDRKELAKRFKTSVYYVTKALQINGEK